MPVGAYAVGNTPKFGGKPIYFQDTQAALEEPMMTVKQHNLDMQQTAAEYQAIIDERDSEMEMLKAEHAYAIDQANKKVAAMQNPRGREKHQPAKRQFWELFCP